MQVDDERRQGAGFVSKPSLPECKVNATSVCGVNFAESDKLQKDVPIQLDRLRARAKFFSWLAVAHPYVERC